MEITTMMIMMLMIIVVIIMLIMMCVNPQKGAWCVNRMSDLSD